MKRIVFILMAAFIAAPLHAGEKGVQQTIAYLQNLRTASGGFLPYDPKGDPKVVPSLRATVSAARALRYFGAAVPNKEATSRFIASCYNAKAGGFSDTPKGAPDVLSTAIGLMGVAELGMPVDKYADGASAYLSENAKSFEDLRIAAAGFEAIGQKPANAEKWVVDVFKLQNKDGTFGKGFGTARDTGSSVVTIIRLGRIPPVPGVYLKAFKNGQRPNGGWGKADSDTASDLETTYRVMRCYHMMKVRPPKEDDLRSFIAKCRNTDGGYGVALGQPSNVSGTYFAAIILHWLNENP